MSFDLSSFVAEPRLAELNNLKKAELMQIAQHYKLTVTSSMGKGEIKKIVLTHFVEEELLPEEELESVNVVREEHLELKRLEFQEKERSIQLRMRELEIREKELAVEFKAKEIELQNAKSKASPVPDFDSTFDVGRHIRFVPPFQETEVDKYFMHFEKIVTSLKWPEDVWTVLLQSVLIGRAREIYSTLPVDQSAQYPIVKEAVLKAYELVPEAYRQKFRSNIKETDQTYVEFARNKERLFDRWCTSQNVNGEYGKLRQLLLLEEFKNCLPNEVKTYIEERKAENLQRAAVLADDYVLTHQKTFNKTSAEPIERNPKNPNVPVLSNRYSLRSNERGHNDTSVDHSRKATKFSSIPICHYCKRKGHIMSECWALEKKNKKTALTVKKVGPTCTTVEENTTPVVKAEEFKPFISQGLISLVGEENRAKPIKILRDTGASQSLMREDVITLSPQSFTGSYVLIQGVESKVVSVPLHIVNIHTPLVSGPVMVGVMNSLPVEEISLILGNDLAGDRVMADPCVCSKPCLSIDPNEGELQKSGVFPSCAVTRAMANRKANIQTDITSKSNQNDDPPISSIDLSETALSHGSRLEPTNLSNKQKFPSQSGTVETVSSPHLTQTQLIKDQEADAELMVIAQNAGNEQEAESTPVCYFMKDGVLKRKWRPPHVPSTHDWEMTYQIVVPRNCQEEVMKIAHSTPLAGHLGVSKTCNRILQHFYWPGIRKDVRQYCRLCHICQLAGKPNQKAPVAPLIPIPAFEEPFSRVIIDCVGPLPKTKTGNKFLLTIMCASTCFPEAIPLRNIKTRIIVKALIKFFTLMGLPKSIQSDQGSNFMAGLFQQVMYQLGIQQFKSSAYHPESQGALERFHSTLKQMLRTYCLEHEKEWDEGVHLVLFAAREAVQESLGFSPFELVFGRSVRGPLKLLKEYWLDKDTTTNLLDYVSDLHSKLYTATKLAQENLKTAQRKMKVWYDKRAQSRNFKPGDKVLILLPLHGHPLQAHYSGPYIVEEKVNEVNYIIKTPERRKQRRLCHINMLKEYCERVTSSEKDKPTSVVSTVLTTAASFSKGGERPSEDTLSRNEFRLNNSDVLANLEMKLSHLTSKEKIEMTNLIQEFILLFPDTPSKTTAIFHDVDIGDAMPCKQHPYRINPFKQQHLQKEIEYMLENDIIEPSSSDWSSPCILVPKPDGRYRFCTDFRKLNALTKIDSYPIPRVDDCIDKIGPAKFVSKLDLLKGYWQVPLTGRAKQVSAFVTSRGLYQYKVMPFGMKNAPATFQRLINQLVGDLDGCDGYLDDVIVCSETWEQHLLRVRALFERLAQAHLTVNLKKSEFGHAHVTYLGHVVGQGQVSPIMSKVEAITNFPVPGSKRELMRFLGMAGYYRKFCKNFSVVTSPLTDLLKKHQPYKWLPTCQQAFERVKAILQATPVLATPDFGQQFKLMVDASDLGAGAVLQQEDDHGVDHPVSYFSAKFDVHQKKYSTIEKRDLSFSIGTEAF